MRTFYFNPVDGRLSLEKPTEFKEYLKGLRPRRHTLEIKEYSDRRSNGANAYYWAVVVKAFMDEMGCVDSESNRAYMHYDVLGQELRLVDDELRPGKKKVQQTHTMTAKEFWAYIEKCEYLFNEYYHGSFPPPRSIGYDTTKA